MYCKKILNITLLLLLSSFLFSQDALTIDEHGKVIVEKDLEVNGTLTVKGGTEQNQDIILKSPVKVEKTLNVTQGITAESTLNVTGDTTVKKVNAENIDVTGTLKNTKTNTTYDPLPVGTILMFNGSGWVDNVTMQGWYQCNGSNGTPNLVNRFIMGSNSSGTMGGDTDFKVTLSKDNMPPHTHSINLDHPPETFTTNTNSGHKHTIPNYNSMNGDMLGKVGSSDGIEAKLTETGEENAHTHTIEVDLGAHEDNSGSAGGKNGVAQSFDIAPAYYTVIFIMKVN